MSSASADTPLVAIVTPVYNGETYLAETMDAVQNQRYPNLVHIVLDNASTDGTSAILARYASAKVPVRVSRNANLLPLGPNWNAAVALVPPEAKYFRTLSADDLIAPDYAARTVALGERHPDVAAIAVLFHNNSGPTIDTGWPRDREVLNGRETMARYFRRECWLPAAHVLFRRRELDKYRPFFEERLIAFDLEAVTRALTRSDLGIVHEDLAMTRLHEETITSTALDKEMIHLGEWLYFLRHFGPEALGTADARRLIRLYERRYFRLLMKARLTDPALFAIQMASLKKMGMRPGPEAFLDALADWPLARFRLRGTWNGYPFPA